MKVEIGKSGRVLSKQTNRQTNAIKKWEKQLKKLCKNAMLRP